MFGFSEEQAWNSPMEMMRCWQGISCICVYTKQLQPLQGKSISVRNGWEVLRFGAAIHPCSARGDEDLGRNCSPCGWG